jgi:hypothetical protein
MFVSDATNVPMANSTLLPDRQDIRHARGLRLAGDLPDPRIARAEVVAGEALPPGAVVLDMPAAARLQATG